MMSKVLSSIAIIGIFGIIGYEYMQANYLQERFASFVSKGPRFTAYDGKELCEFSNIIAVNSIGFRQSGLNLLDCDKYLRDVK